MGGTDVANADPVPVSARVHRLRNRLIALRKASGLTARDICVQMGRPNEPINESTFWRWESPVGVANMPWQRVMALCKVYGADEATTDQLIALAQDSEQLLGWLERDHGGAPTPYLGTLVGFEMVAPVIRTFHNAAVPGLLQIEEYARALIAASVPRLDTEEVNRRVAIRIDRAESVLAREDPPQVWAVITEGALRHQIVRKDAMRAQLDHLIQLANRPNITLQVLGFECDATPASGCGPITLCELPGADEPAIVYLELPRAGLFIEEEDDVKRHAEILDHVRAAALAPAESRARIAAIARGL